MKKSDALSILPTTPTSSKVNPKHLSYLLIAEPKWGKTTFFMSNPDSILLGFEDGHKFQHGHKMSIDCWDDNNFPIKTDKTGVKHVTFMQAIDALEALPGKFSMVIIDTADVAVKMCSDYHCGKKRVEHPSDFGAMGKGWDVLITTPFRQAMMRLLKTGRGLAFITHSKVEVMKYTAGEKAVKGATLSGGPMKFVFAQADVVMHGEMGKKQAGERLRDRVLVTEMDSDIVAGNRTRALLPARYIVDKKNPWKQFETFFVDPKASDKAEADCKRLSK